MYNNTTILYMNEFVLRQTHSCYTKSYDYIYNSFK